MTAENSGTGFVHFNFSFALIFFHWTSMLEMHDNRPIKKQMVKNCKSIIRDGIAVVENPLIYVL